MKIKLLLSILISATVSTPLLAAANNFNCPQPSEITPTNFTAPSIWTAPPVAYAKQNTIGLGLGGKAVKEFLGAEAATIGGKPGWVCVYRSDRELSINEYKAKITEKVQSISYLRQYINKVNDAFAQAEPYLDKYPKDEPLGFVAYQMEQDVPIR